MSWYSKTFRNMPLSSYLHLGRCIVWDTNVFENPKYFALHHNPGHKENMRTKSNLSFNSLPSMEPYGHSLKLFVLIKIGFVARALKRQIVFVREGKLHLCRVITRVKFHFKAKEFKLRQFVCIFRPILDGDYVKHV